MGDRAAIRKRLEDVHWLLGWGDYDREPATVSEAANFFGLKPDDPRLLYALAEVAFGRSRKGRRPGTKTAWPNDRLLRLGELCHEIEQKNPRRKLSDARIAQLIHNKEGAGFENVHPDQIRQRLRAARETYREAEEQVFWHKQFPDF